MTEQNHEYYVSLEVAKLLKEAGFDWETKSYYADNKSGVLYGYNNSIANWNAKNFFMRDSNGSIFVSNGTYIDSITGYYIKASFFSAPTLDVAQRWLREVKKYYIVITLRENKHSVINSDGWTFHYEYHDPVFDFEITDEKGETIYISDNTYKTYEETQEAAIKKALEMI